jgi:hypothetical protein
MLFPLIDLVLAETFRFRMSKTYRQSISHVILPRSLKLARRGIGRSFQIITVRHSQEQGQPTWYTNADIRNCLGALKPACCMSAFEGAASRKASRSDR